MHNWNNDRLTEESIATCLLQRDELFPNFAQTSLRLAAVLIPLYWGNEGWELYFTRRTDTVQYHKGQVSFPGGVVEPGDEDVVATALRESQEEIGLSPANVRVLGIMNAMPTTTGYLITPVVGRVYLTNPLINSQSEVEKIFSIPLAWLADHKHWEERDFTRSDGKVERLVFYQTYEDELVWGITGRIVVNFLKTIRIEK